MHMFLMYIKPPFPRDHAEVHGLRQQSLKYKTMPYTHSETSSVKPIKHFKENLAQAVETGRLLILAGIY